MRAYEKALSADARAALQIIASLPSSRAAEALTALTEGTLVEHFWLHPRAREQIRFEFTNYVYLIDAGREELTESFVFSRFLWIVKNFIRDGLVIPRAEYSAGLLTKEDDFSEDALLSRLGLKNKNCSNIEKMSGHKPRRPGVRHKAAERALILALREKRSLSGQRVCPDKKEVSGHKMRQGVLFKKAA